MSVPNKIVENGVSLWNGGPKLEAPALVMNDSGNHQLLVEQATSYSASVVQRSFITWMQLGKKNSFRNICMYYRELEKLESTLTPEQSYQSRQLEYESINKPPSSSPYFDQRWGHIYKQSDNPTSRTEVEDKLANIWNTAAEPHNSRLMVSQALNQPEIMVMRNGFMH